ncbi:MAG: hypothetical protein ACP5IJ_01315 [Candidatus Nanoarchaeia archaeon]
MSNIITLLDNEKIRYKGTFDLKALYEHALNWLLWRNFEVSEKRYILRKKPSGNELFIDWEAVKNVDEYSQIKISVRYMIIGLKDVEAKVAGKPKTMQNGDLFLFVSASLVTDRQEFWAQNVFYSFLRAFYDRFIYRTTIERLKSEISNLGWTFFNELKAFLQTFRYVS